jgi:hypothetical protein
VGEHLSKKHNTLNSEKQNFSTESLKARRALNYIFQALKENNYQKMATRGRKQKACLLK